MIAAVAAPPRRTAIMTLTVVIMAVALVMMATLGVRRGRQGEGYRNGHRGGRDGENELRDRRADRQLREALAWAAALDSGYSARNGARPIVVEAGEGLAARIYWVIADAGVIMFSFSRAALDESRLAFAAAVYGLSPAQSRLVRLVAEGLALPEIAERMNITPHTARTHLNRVFDKTGVRSQAALVRVLLTAVAPL